MCAVTMFTVQITREHHVGKEDVQECLRQLNCGKSLRRLREICFVPKRSEKARKSPKVAERLFRVYCS